MTNLRKHLVTVAFAALAVSHGAAPAGAANRSSLRVEPAKGISLDVGSKHAVAYFLAANGGCNLTLMLSDVFTEDDQSIPSAARVNVAIGAGTTARIDTVDGPSLAFQCTPGAAAMSVETVDRVAYEPMQR